jgi:hypothetical protein
MLNNNRFTKKKRLTQSIGALVAMAATMSAQAMHFEFNDSGVVVDWDTSVKYGVQWRVEDPDPNLDNFVATANTNDGTNNFDKGVVSNRVSLLTEADFQWRNYGFFVRGKALYDHRYEDGNANQTQETYLSDNSGDGAGAWLNVLDAPLGTTARRDFNEDMLDIQGKDAFFLDAFVYGDFEVGEKLLSARVGRQVISWGESLFFQGISGAQNYADAAAANSPGTQVKEIFMPTGAAYVNLEVTPSLNIEAYYQYEWKETKEAGIGSYWSNSDISGDGSERILFVVEDLGLIIPAPVTNGEDPSDSGQWGVALRYFLESGTEFGLYRLRYHDKFPSFVGVADPTAVGPLARLPVQMLRHYEEDLDMYGASFSTLVGDVNIVGELTYVPDSVPTQSLVPVPNPETGGFATGRLAKGDVIQGNLGVFYVWGKTPVADSINLLGEAVYVSTDVDEDDMLNDEDAWGYAFNADFNYNSVMSGIDLAVKTSFKHAVDGSWKTLTLTDSAKEGSLGLQATYLKRWKGNVKYSRFWGAKSINTKQDRDNITVTVQYSF